MKAKAVVTSATKQAQNNLRRAVGERSADIVDIREGSERQRWVPLRHVVANGPWIWLRSKGYEMQEDPEMVQC
jgi:hypothetical protein